MIGSLGSIVFEASSEQILTFQDLSIQRSANYSEHKIIGQTGIAEFTGLNAGTCSLKISLDYSLGIDPNEQLAELERLLNTHEANMFVLDGKPIGSGYWVIESLNASVELLDNFGTPLRIIVSLNLKEYILM